MSRSRYEPVPQADQEIIELGSDPSYNYNYNTAIPNSPPPSFHSSQSTPAVSVLDFEHDRAISNSTPRATSPPSPSPSQPPVPGASATGTDARLADLHRRVGRLEESLGRLLLEKGELDSRGAVKASSSSSSRPGGSNCCVAFPDPAAFTLAERAELLCAGSNCCVTFGRRGGGAAAGGEEERAHRRQCVRQWAVGGAFAFLLFVVLGWITLLVWLKNRPGVMVVGCESCLGQGGGAGGGPWSAAGQGKDGAWSSSG